MPACARISASGRAPFLVWAGLNIENNYFWQYLELGDSFISPEPRKRSEVMILYYDTEGHMRREMVGWLPEIPHDSGAR